MIVQTYRFGSIEIDEDDVLLFPEGLVGLVRLKRFVLLRDPQSKELYWLQSLDEREFALACMHASLLSGQFEMDIASSDVSSLKLAAPNDAEVFLVINRVDGVLTANLKGPIIINSSESIGKQVVLTADKYEVRHRILTTREPALTA